MVTLPRIVADGPLDAVVTGLLEGHVLIEPWSLAQTGDTGPISGVYTYGHPLVDGAMMDRLPGLKVISNYGVGVDHIRLDDAHARGILVGNTPGVLEGATADLGFALLLAAARRIVEGDRYARSAAFTRYDPGYMLGREAHHATLGIVGMGNIGYQVAKRARAFDMTVLYHNRRRRPDAEAGVDARFVTLDELLGQSDYVMLCVPLTSETHGMFGAAQFALMRPTATLINIARGPVVQMKALHDALSSRTISSAAIDVTDPEPLPRDHPLLRLSNLVITPHLGSATIETRRKMAERSVANLLAGLRGEPLPSRVA